MKPSKDNRPVSTGFYTSRQHGVIMYEVEGLEAREDVRERDYRELYRRYMNESACVNVGGYYVPVWGVGHNLYPQEVSATIEENKLLPGIIGKRIDYLYGRGPYLYTKEIVNGKEVRTPVHDARIQTWLESWEAAGYDDYRSYLRNLITDYYHVRTCCSQYHFSRSRALKANGSVIALSYVGADEARLASDVNPVGRRIKQSDCRFVAVGDWTRIGGASFDVWPRFNPASPYAQAEAVSFSTDKNFCRYVYAYNGWYEGLKEWIKASNLTPKYLNSYLKNALNAHIHCKIPFAWYSNQKEILSSICSNNINGISRTEEYKGVKLFDENNLPYSFAEAMMEDLINHELKRITEMLSGEGKNQGKLWASTKVGDEGWEFEEMPGKFKEYFESVISYDKRADQVTLAGVGISSSITNVENDGVISKSGSDVYYNYVVYMNTLVFPDQFICREINRAIAMNFPYVREKGIMLGFHLETPSRQSEVSPSDRLTNQQPAV